MFSLTFSAGDLVLSTISVGCLKEHGADYFVPFDLSPIFGVLKAQSVKQKV